MPLNTKQTLFGKYRVERMIGEGGFGYVYEATDLNLNRRVAIKELRPELASNQTMFTRFLNEARAVAALNDPHIVTLLEYQREGSQHYLVFEYMDGGSLANLMAKRGKLEPAEAAMIAKAVCDGLAVVHRKGIIHRDMKQANILLNQDGRVIKIGDFGIAHVPTAVSGMVNLTRTGAAMGTPWYMSPEQARGETVDARSDLYSLGVMLFEMTMGHMYLDFKSDFLRDLDMIKATPPRPIPASIPTGLRQIISKSLEKDPARRFQSAEEMSAALQMFVTPGVTVVVPRTDPGRIRLPDRPSASRSLPLPWIIGGGVLAAMLILVCVIGLALSRISGTSVPGAAAPSAAPNRTEIAGEILATQTASARATQDLANAAATLVASKVTAVPTIGVVPPATSAPTVKSQPIAQNTLEPKPVTTISLTNADRLTQLALIYIGQTPILSLSWLPNGNSLSVISRSNIAFYNPPNLNPGTVSLPIDANFSGALTRDGGKVLVDSKDRIPKLYELPSGKVLQTFRGHQNGDVRVVAISPDGGTFATGADDKDVRIWGADGFSFGALQPDKHVGSISSLAYAPNSRLLASGARDQIVKLWDVTRWKRGSFDLDPGHFDNALLWSGAQQNGTIFSLAFSPDGATLASGAGDGTILLWRVADGTAQGRLAAQKPENTTSLVFSSDGVMLVSGEGIERKDAQGNLLGTESNTVRLWKVSDRSLVREILGFPNFVVSLAFSPDGRYLAMGTADGYVSLWGVPQ